MKYQWLKDYKQLEQQIEYLKWNLNRSELELARWIKGDLVNIKLEKNSRSSNLENHSWRKEVAKKLTRSPGLNEYVETYIKFLDYKTEIEKGVVSN